MKTLSVVILCLSGLFLMLSFPRSSYSQGSGVYHEMTIQVNGVDRQYTLYEPQGHNTLFQWPVVFNFHGFYATAASQINISQMYFVADTSKFFIVYPQGLPVEDLIFGGTGPGWNVPGNYAAPHDDIDFIHKIIKELIAHPDFTIDTNRLYAAGNSNGGEMAFYLACALSERIASCAGVAAQMAYIMMDFICTPDRPVSTLQMLGTEDPFFPVDGDEFFPPLEGASEYWASINNCDSIPTITFLPDLDPGDGSTVTLKDYDFCFNGYEVLCYRIEGGGHTWPGGGQPTGVNRDINASSEIWNFFERNPHPNFYSFCMPEGITFSSQSEIDSFHSSHPNCVNIEGNVIISGDDISNLLGLDAIISIGGSLSMIGNDSLQNLSGLDNLTSIGGDLIITENPALVSLTGLDILQADSISNLYIHSNVSLTTCAIQSICDYLASPNGEVVIENNAPGCNSGQEVVEICESVSIDEVRTNNSIIIFPNPAINGLFITAGKSDIKELTIYSVTGQQVLQERPVNGNIDISHLQPGMYIVEVTVEGRKVRRKLLVE